MKPYSNASEILWQNQSGALPWQEQRQVYHLEPGAIVTKVSCKLIDHLAMQPCVVRF